MVLPLIPIAAGVTGTAAGVALHHWITNDTPDSWEDKAVFNARMRDMQSLGVAINTGFIHCHAFLKDPAQPVAWRGARDGFSKFYETVGTLVYSSPNSAQIEQAKSYASKFFFWVGEYNRLKCGSNISPAGETYPKPAASTTNPTDWAVVAKWSAIGIGGAFIVKTVTDLFKSHRGY